MRYEDLDADPVRVASGVLAFLGLDLPAGRAITVRHKRLADEISARWAAAYRRREAAIYVLRAIMISSGEAMAGALRSQSP